MQFRKRVFEAGWVFHKMRFINKMYFVCKRSKRFIFRLRICDLPWEYISQTYAYLPWDSHAIALSRFTTTDNVIECIMSSPKTNIVCISTFCASNPNLDISVIAASPAEIWGRLNWTAISMHPSVSLDDVVRFPQLPWSHVGFSFNDKVTEMHVFYNENTKNWKWNFTALSVHMPLSAIARHLDCLWDFEIVSERATEDEVLAYPEIPWVWEKFKIPTIRGGGGGGGSISQIDSRVTKNSKRPKWKSMDELRSHIFNASASTAFESSLIIVEDDDFQDDKNAYVGDRLAHFAKFDFIHEELMNVLFDFDNRWYHENIIS